MHLKFSGWIQNANTPTFIFFHNSLIFVIYSSITSLNLKDALTVQISQPYIYFLISFSFPQSRSIILRVYRCEKFSNLLETQNFVSELCWKTILAIFRTIDIPEICHGNKNYHVFYYFDIFQERNALSPWNFDNIVFQCAWHQIF